MAKTIRSIQVDFNNALQQADKLLDCSNEIDDVVKKLDDVINGLSSCWSGDAAKAYIAKCDELKTKINKTSKNVHKVSDKVEKAAKIYYEAEKKAAELAKQFSGK